LESTNTWNEYVKTIETSEIKSNVDFAEIILIELLSVLTFCYRKKNESKETKWTLETIIKLVDSRVILILKKIKQIKATDFESKMMKELSSL
jgi:predicted nucleic-acid-binding protein